jgi:hypothetical protein
MQDASQYRERWAAVQAHFVDAPKEAVEEAHQLVHEVMKKRGYPVTGFEQAAADLSVEYPTIDTGHNRIASMKGAATAWLISVPRNSGAAPKSRSKKHVRRVHENAKLKKRRQSYSWKTSQNHRRRGKGEPELAEICVPER